MPETPDVPRRRTWGGRLAEGAVMALTMFLLRLLFIALHLFRHESFMATVVASVGFGLTWMLIAFLWDLIRGQAGRR